jgi:iron complex outermembrane recepter protein
MLSDFIKLNVKSVLLASAGLLLLPTVAIAQDRPPADDVQRANDGGIADIIVTAQRREQQIQDVPIAITALDEAAIENLNSRDIRDLTGSVPNVVISDVAIGPGLAQISIRGVNSQDPEKNFDPAVGIFLDNIYLGSSAFNLLDSFSLERIEVLRGPQGTLFGRNTTGGAVNAMRRRPKGELGARGKVTLGNFGQTDFQGEINLPKVGDVVSILLRGQRAQDDGFYKNTAGGATGAKDSWSIGGALRLNSPDVADITISYDHAEDDSELPPFFAAGVRGISPLPINITQTTFPVPASITAAFPADAFCVVRNRCFDTENRTSSITSAHRLKARLDALTFNGDFPISDSLDITAVLGWRSSTEEVLIDFDGTNENVFNVRRDQDYEQYSAEVRIASSFDGPINFVAGSFYFDSQYTLNQAIKLDRALVGIPPFGATYINGSGDNDAYQSETFAVFSQAEWDFAERWKLTLGGRLTWDKKAVQTQFRGTSLSPTAVYEVEDGVPDNRPITSQGAAKENWFQFTPKLMVSYVPNDDALLYASFTRGYNAGGFSTRAGTVADVTTSFEPEFVNAYEFGGKFDLLDRRLRVNFSAFWNDYSDKQEEARELAPPPTFTSTTVRNIASARLRGMELELSALPIDDLRIDLSVGYLDAQYTNFDSFLGSGEYVSVPAQPRGTLIAADFSNLSPRRAPKLTSSLSLNYKADLGFGELVLNGQGRYVSEQYTELYNSERGLLESSLLFDASATVRFGGVDQDRFNVTIFGKNLTNNVDVQSFTNAIVDFGLNTVPRRYGIEFGFNF